MYFSTGVSQRQMMDLCRDIRLAEVAEKSGIDGLEQRIDELERQLPALIEGCKASPDRATVERAEELLAFQRELLVELRALDAATWEGRHTDLVRRVRELGDAVDSLERQAGG